MQDYPENKRDLTLLKRECLRNDFLERENQRVYGTFRRHTMIPNLIEIYASTNHAMRVNWTISYADTNEFCRNPENKTELIESLETLIKTIKEDYGK